MEAMRCTVADRLRATASLIDTLLSVATGRSIILYTVKRCLADDAVASATSIVFAHAPAQTARSTKTAPRSNSVVKMPWS